MGGVRIVTSRSRVIRFVGVLALLAAACLSLLPAAAVAATSPRAETPARATQARRTRCSKSCGMRRTTWTRASTTPSRRSSQRTTSGRPARLQARVRARPARRSCRTSPRRCPRSRPTARTTSSRSARTEVLERQADVKASDFRARSSGLQDRLAGRRLLLDIKGVSGSNGFATTKKGHISGIVTERRQPHGRDQARQPRRATSSTSSRREFAHVPAGEDAGERPVDASGFLRHGPYMIQSYEPNRSFVIVRNPNYNDQIPTMPSGNPDRVEGKIITDPVAAYQRVVSNKSDYDFQPVPNDRLPRRSRSTRISCGSTRTRTRTTSRSTTSSRRSTTSRHARRRSTRSTAARSSRACTAVSGSRRRTSCRRATRSTRRSTTYTFDLAKAKQLVQQSGTAGQTVDVYGRTRTRRSRPPSTWPTSCTRSATSRSCIS